MSLDSIPISADLIKHIKTLDGFSGNEVGTLKWLVNDLVKKEANLDLVTIKELESEQEFYLQILLKIHQVLALLDIDWTKAGATEDHSKEILASLKKHGGLDYLPRERTPAGRSFEHASDCRILLKLIMKSEVVEDKEAKNEKILSINLAHDDNAKTEGSACVLDKNLMQISIKANGKADLYLHAYTIYHYVNTLYTASLLKSSDDFEKLVKENIELGRLKGLSDALRKVAMNLPKYPFNEQIYMKHVNDFGGRKSIKKQKILEEIQKSLFVAQIADDKEALGWIERLLI